jgi:putative addiction module component (TIGR02574 family)
MTMELSPDLVHQVLSLPVQERYELAHHLLDSIDENAATSLDEEFLAELRRRRDEMLRGEELVSDWRSALSNIDRSLPARNQG